MLNITQAYWLIICDLDSIWFLWDQHYVSDVDLRVEGVIPEEVADEGYDIHLNHIPEFMKQWLLLWWILAVAWKNFVFLSPVPASWSSITGPKPLLLLKLSRVFSKEGFCQAAKELGVVVFFYFESPLFSSSSICFQPEMFPKDLLFHTLTWSAYNRRLEDWVTRLTHFLVTTSLNTRVL